MAIKLKGLAPQKIIEKKNMLKGKRANFEGVWQQIGDYIVPTKSDIQSVSSPGEAIYNHLLDSTGVNSNELLAGALHGMLTNPSGYFFGLTTGIPKVDSMDAPRMWLQNVTRIMHEVLNNSNFHTEVHEMYVDLTGFGNGPMSMEEDEDTIVRFASRPLKEIFIEENSRGVVDCLYRCYELDARGLVDDFGLENLPEEIRKEYTEGKDCSYEMIHAIYPVRKVGEYQKTKFKYVSQYVLVKKKLTLEIGGFYEFPYLVPRWTKRSGESYGRGCGEKALPEAKCLNKMTETTLRGAQKVVDPPLQAPDDGFVLPLVTRPAGLNYYRAGSQDRIEPIFNAAQIDFGYQAIELKKSQVREAFFIDQLKLREGPQMTATEVMERVEQALRFLGPQLGRQQSEFLQPLIVRLYAILDRKGLIPELPSEMMDARTGRPLEIKVMYSSVMAMAQRASELQNVNRFFANIAPLMSVNPQAGDNIDVDAGVKYIGKLLNLPQEFLLPKKDVDSIRESRARAQQEMQARAQEMDDADTASKAATAASKLAPKGQVA